ncbi:iron chelate uptake ABC transporter family permease subunit, partial [Escherichia coli]|nr:iron chelate uptake ABC transporter family permease subunit [Escherichia coli]
AGSVAGRDLELLVQVLPYVSLGLLLALGLARQITTLTLGDEVAAGLGQRTGLVKLLAALAVVLLAGSAVSVAGPIGFV